MEPTIVRTRPQAASTDRYESNKTMLRIDWTVLWGFGEVRTAKVAKNARDTLCHMIGPLSKEQIQLLLKHKGTKPTKPYTCRTRFCSD